MGEWRTTAWVNGGRAVPHLDVRSGEMSQVLGTDSRRAVRYRASWSAERVLQTGSESKGQETVASESVLCRR